MSPEAPLVFPLRSLYLYFRPFSTLKSPVRQAHSHDLVAHDSEPDADDSDLQYIAEQVRTGRADDGDTEGRSTGGEHHISRTPETSHVDDLGDLQEYDHSHDLHDPGTHGDNIFLNKVQVEIPVS